MTAGALQAGGTEYLWGQSYRRLCWELNWGSLQEQVWLALSIEPSLQPTPFYHICLYARAHSNHRTIREIGSLLGVDRFTVLVASPFTC